VPRSFQIEPDIRRAQTPPGWLYTDPETFAAQRAAIFERSWHVVDPDAPAPAATSPPASDASRGGARGFAAPFTLLPELLDEPLVAVTDADGSVRILSNTCTHRGNLVVEHACAVEQLRCRYHGRRFELTGRLRSMPEFERVEGFPRPSDDLRALPTGSFGPVRFVAIEPPVTLDAALEPLVARARALRMDAMILDPGASADYEVAANWALYCDNYLEGFHIPYVHAGLNAVLDYSGYRTETHPWGVMQIGASRSDEDAFHLPADHPDAGQRIAAYYYWLFPATMLNLYPWGLSLNVVEPLAVDRTRVRFRSYVADPSRRGSGAGGALHDVEMEDEEVVEATHRGLKARLYSRGRYSPTQEIGVHHFHRLLAHAMFGTHGPRSVDTA
jgi:choline monooxygenase